jgi:UDP-N-acetylmuramoylalanine--D-glutamate ligase
MGLALQKNDTDNVCETIVIGLGETGLSVAEYLSQKNIAFTMMDTRSNPPLLSMFQKEYPDVDVYLESSAIELLRKTAQTSQLILSPGVDTNNAMLSEVISKNNYECIGDIELFARSTKKPIVAITGSNGKSTVTSLLAEMASSSGVVAYAGGNLGPPALDLLKHEDAELFVLELSSFQLESTQTLQPEVSVVLNISPDHLDRHGDVDNYAHIKEHIYTNAKISVINRDDEYVSAMKTSGQVISFGLGQPSEQPGEDEFGVICEGMDEYLAFGEQRLLSVNELALKGESGILNSLAALTIGHALKLPMHSMLAKLKNFKGLPHRLAFVAEQNGVSWFNDSKGTNIGATISSLRSLSNNNVANIILIAGGVFKGGDLEQLKVAISKYAKHVILLGQDASVIRQGLGVVVPIDMASSMSDAIKLAEKKATAGDRVLLSPACASFDMYDNYIERGNDFEALVKDFLL